MPVGFPPLSNLCILTSALELDLLRSEKNCRTNSVLYRGARAFEHVSLLFTLFFFLLQPLCPFQLLKSGLNSPRQKKRITRNQKGSQN